MIVTRYKPLFSFAASYELSNTVITADGLILSAPLFSLNTMTDFKLKPQFKDNTATVYFEGKETPANAPVSSTPAIVISTEEYFYFTISFSDKERIKRLKFHSTEAIAKEIGFHVFYKALIPTNAAMPAVTIQEDVKVIAPVFTLTVSQAQAGFTSAYAALEITDEQNNLVSLNVNPAALASNITTGFNGYMFSIDASALLPGIYNFKAGNYEKKFFIAPNIDISDSVLLVRVLKNSFLEYKTSLADNSFAAFELLIPKA